MNGTSRIKGTDHAIWSRIILIPWEVRFVGPDDDPDAARGARVTKPKDPNIGERLLGELPGILAWAVRGCLLWQREGLHRPEAVREATRAYRAQEDRIGAFLEELCCVPTEEWTNVPETGATVLYRAYRRWAEERGETPVTQTEFGTRLTEKGVEKKKTNHGFVYQGIGLKDLTAGESE